MMTRSRIFTMLTLLTGVLVLSGAASAVPTPFEESGGLRTPTYENTMAWFADLAEGSPLIELTTFGTSPQGRSLPLVIADRQGRFAPADHHDRTGRVVLLVQACIHAGESCGKDAGMLLLRDLAEDPALAAELLDRVTILFVPIFNVDGHERFSPYSRVNQNGPEEMGWRVTGQNLNLNRDYLKADTPEMRAWLGMFNEWLPDFFIDIHSTDGADYQYPITYSLETRGNMDPGLTEWTIAYEEKMNEAMAADGFPMAPYVAFKKWHDPRSGLKTWVATPRFSQGYTALQNRPGLLIETHMLKDYATRVQSAKQLVTHTLGWLNTEAEQLCDLVAAADEATAGADFRSEPYPLKFDLAADSTTVAFAGVSYETITSEVTGGEWNRFTGEPETSDLWFFGKHTPSVTADLPEAYIIPPAWTVAIERLAAHGVAFRRLASPAELEIRTWKFSEAKWRERPYEGRHPVTFTAEPLTETRLFPAGSVVVDMNQRAARVAAHLLEPKGPDSLVQWGFFDAVFEQVEYVESYVIEEMIIEMLKEDPSLAVELAERKAADPEFAADPWAIRYWFYAKTPYFDQRVGIYPVGALDSREVVDSLN
ncbi:MAG: M14 family metallopeptidase [Candidatus Krumholzibacteriota bacterium]